MLWDVLATPAPEICDRSEDLCFRHVMSPQVFLGASISFPCIVLNLCSFPETPTYFVLKERV